MGSLIVCTEQTKRGKLKRKHASAEQPPKKLPSTKRIGQVKVFTFFNTLFFSQPMASFFIFSSSKTKSSGSDSFSLTPFYHTFLFTLLPTYTYKLLTILHTTIILCIPIFFKLNVWIFIPHSSTLLLLLFIHLFIFCFFSYGFCGLNITFLYVHGSFCSFNC